MDQNTQSIQDKIRSAAIARGIDPEVALRIANAESTLSNSAKNTKSSARGLFQIIDSTWKNFGGDPAKRDDVDENIRVGLNVIAGNRDSFLKRFNKEPSQDQLYNMHVLGTGDAFKVFNAKEDEALKNIVPPKVIKANPYMGKMSVADFINFTQNKMAKKTPVAPSATSVVRVDGAVPMPQAPKETMKAPEKTTTPMNRDLLAELGPSYQAALGAISLADSADEDEDELLAEKYADRFGGQENEVMPSTLGEVNLTYASPFEEPQQEPVRLAFGGLPYAPTAMLRKDVVGGANAAINDYNENLERYQQSFISNDKGPIVYQQTRGALMPIGGGNSVGYNDKNIVRVPLGDGKFYVRQGDYRNLKEPNSEGAEGGAQASADARAKQRRLQLTYDVMSNPESYNLSLPQVFAEGGEAETGSASDMLKQLKQALVPAQIRTFIETVAMDKGQRANSPITEKDFSESELRQILDTIGNARKNRAKEKGLNSTYTPTAKDISLDKLFEKMMGKDPAFQKAKERTEAEKKHFESGSGSVNYMDYPGFMSGLRDTTVSGQGAIRNTLGRFVYETLPDGRIKVKDTYDFKDDLVTDLGQRPSAAYKDMGTMGKLGTILVDTLNNPMDLQSEEGGTKVGRATLPSRVGSAFIGQNGRPVNITLDPRELMPGYAGYAYGGPVHRANGSPMYGEMVPDSGPITADTRAALSNFQVPNASEMMAALKRIYGEGASNAESMVRGSVAAVPGTFGDIGQAFNIRGMRDLPTTEQLLKKYPQRMTQPTKEADMFTDIGTYVPPPVSPSAVTGTAKAMLKGLKESGPQIESAVARKAPAFAPMNITPEGAKILQYMDVPESSLFTSAVDSFVASQKNPVTKQQLLGQMKGKFRDYEIGRVSEALADLPDTARILPNELAARVSQSYPTNRISTYTLEPAKLDRWASMDNPYPDFPVGVINMRFNTPIEKVRKAITNEDTLEVLTSLSGRTSSLPKEAEIKMLSDYVSSLPNAKEYTGLSKQLDTVRKTATLAEKELKKLDGALRPYKYPALTDNWSDLITDYLKKNSDTNFNDAKKAVNLKIQREADNDLKKIGIEIPPLNLSLEERLAKIESQIAVKRNQLIENAKDVLFEMNDKVRPEMVNLANELKKDTVYKGQHVSLTPKRSPIGFSRFVDQTANIPGMGETKVMHMIELQSDLYDDIIKQGSKSGSKAKDIEEIGKIKPKITELLANPKVKDAAGKINHIRSNFPSTANVERSEEIAKIIQGNPEIKKELIEYLKLSDKEGKLNARSKYSGKYDIDEPFYGIEKSPQVVQQMMIKNAIGAAMKRGVNAVTFPGKESKQAQLYEKLEPNLKQAVKDLGVGFEIRPIEMSDSAGNIYSHLGVVWNPDTAKRVLKEGIRFNKGGPVDKNNLDYAKYI